MRETGNLVRPKVLGADRVVRVAVHEEVLEAAHVLHAEDGDLVLRLFWRSADGFPFLRERDMAYLMNNGRQRGVLALEPLLDAMPARRPRLLALLFRGQPSPVLSLPPLILPPPLLSKKH